MTERQKLISGDFEGRAIRAWFQDGDNPKVKIEMEVGSGPEVGRRVTFDGRVDDKNIRNTKQAMLAVGWRGEDLGTLPADVLAMGLTVPFTVEIARWTSPKGEYREWSTVRRIGAMLGVGEVDPARVTAVNARLAKTDVAATDEDKVEETHRRISRLMK